ncbi:MAG TPA: Nif3-like dinuclear metal center hexameric protein [Cyclobacteriaceae bacterium]|jgi:putative NIF3 family GTP cyclohydrolase 1 type 2
MNTKKSACSGGAMQRRDFITAIASAVGATSLPLVAFPALAANPRPAVALTVQQVIDLILAEIPGAPFPQTVDTIKAGEANQAVTGIVTTMFATVEVIRKCAARNANFIIAHEPTFYNHQDDTTWLEDDKVYQFKADLLKKHGITVWRFHDYMHSHRPDGVRIGVLTKLEWQKYYEEDSAVVTIPQMTLEDLLRHAKSRLGITQAKVLGDPRQVCKRVAIMPGASGGRSHLQVLKRERPDVFLCGEVNEWETTEYIRDARAMGESVSLVVLGHALSEEPGMEWLVTWLQPKVGGIRVTHLASGDPYSVNLS